VGNRARHQSHRQVEVTKQRVSRSSLDRTSHCDTQTDRQFLYLPRPWRASNQIWQSWPLTDKAPSKLSGRRIVLIKMEDLPVHFATRTSPETVENDANSARHRVIRRPPQTAHPDGSNHRGPSREPGLINLRTYHCCQFYFGRLMYLRTDQPLAPIENSDGAPPDYQ